MFLNKSETGHSWCTTQSTMALSMGLFAKPFIISRVQNHLKYIVASPTLSSSLSFNTKFTSSLPVAAETNSFTKLSDESPPLSGLESVITGYILGKKKATEVAHAVWTNVVRKGDVVVDATCGNGYDTLAMLRLVADDELQIGRVYAMDLQKDALESTSSFLDKSVNPHKRERVELHAICHSKMEEIVPRGIAVRLVAFNLGYLPGGDKKIKTDPETTLLALEAAKRILAPGGLICIVAYVGHFGGREEFEVVESFAGSLPFDEWVCCKLQMLNRPLAPVLVLLYKK